MSKKKKNKGPIRFEAILPTFIILLLIWGYFFLFFDSHLRMGLEYAGTQIHGAEVNLDSVDTNFLEPSIELRRLQITDKNKPHRNIIQIGRIKFQLLWDALLRAKLVVDDATVENIQALVPREKPGKIVPKDSSNSGALANAEKNVLEQSKEQFNENVLGDVANVLDGTDPSEQVKKIQADLKTDARIKELEKLLSEKEKEWKKRLEELPEAKEFEELANRAKKVKIDTKNIVEAAKGLRELEKIAREADKKYKKFEKASKNLNSDVSKFNKSMKDLEKFAKDDLRDLQKRLKIPNVDYKEFSMGLFGKMFQENLVSIKKYAATGRKYMPNKKATKKPELAPRERSKGKDLQFPITTGYPLFWLKRAALSSKSNEGDYNGDLSGEAMNFTSDPKYLKKPATLNIKGDFPKQNIYGVDINIKIDHTTDDHVESIRGIVAKYPISDKKLSDTKDVRFIMEDSVGQARFSGALKNESFTFKMLNEFRETKYDIDAKSSLLKDVLRGVANDLPVLNVESTAKGTWKDFSLDIRSNLGKELERGFKKQLDAKIAEAKKQLQKFIDDKISTQKKKLNSQFDRVKGGVNKQMSEQKSKINDAKKSAEKDLKKREKKGKKDGNKDLNNLLKGIKL